MSRRQTDLSFNFRVSVGLDGHLDERINHMLTALKHGYSMLTCAAPAVVCRFLHRISLVFFSYSLFSLHSTAARLTPFPFTSAGQIGRKGLLPAAMILMADEIASCCACLERSVTYVTRLCMPIFPRRTVVRNGYCKETEYSWKFIYIRSTYYPGHSCWCKPKKCQQQLTPHFLSSASIILFPSIIPLHLLQAVPLPVAL